MRLWSASPGACLEPGGSLGVASGYTRGSLRVASACPQGAHRLATRWPGGGLRVASGWPYLEVANSRWQMALLSAFCILPSTFASAWLCPALQGSKLEVQFAFDVGCWMLVVGCSVSPSVLK